MSDTKLTATRLPEDLIQEYQIYCIKSKKTQSAFIKEAIEEYLRNHPVSN